MTDPDAPTIITVAGLPYALTRLPHPQRVRLAETPGPVEPITLTGWLTRLDAPGARLAELRSGAGNPLIRAAHAIIDVVQTP